MSLPLLQEVVMLVDFKNAWFGPSEIMIRDKIRSISGIRYRKGVHEVDDALEPYLPKTAKIVAGTKKEVKSDKEIIADLKDFDQDRKDADAFQAVTEEADKSAADIELKRKQDAMAKARKAPGAVHHKKK